MNLLVKILFIFVLGLGGSNYPLKAANSEPLPIFSSEYSYNLRIMENQKKVCNNCKKEKDTRYFYKKNNTKDNLRTECITCSKLFQRRYAHRKDGVITNIYGHQKQHSISRGHPLPEYSKNELKEWLLSSMIFNKLFDLWVISGYDKDLIPSCDRKNDSKPYSFNNITIATWKSNNTKANRDMRSGRLIHGNKPQRAVIGINIRTGNATEFVSSSEAARKTGAIQGHISSCCCKTIITKPSGCKYTRKSAGGYTWNFKKHT